MQKKRVVITGAGVVSPVGIGVEKFWKSLLEGKSGIRPVTHFDASAFDSRINGDVIDYDPAAHFNSKDARNLSRFIQFAVVAANEAVAQSKIDIRKEPYRTAVILGSGIGSIYSAEEEYDKYLEKGPGRISPFFITRMIINEAAGQVSINTGAMGPCFAIATACATANNCIGEAMRMIQAGEVDVAIAGGTESATSKLGLGGFCALKALSKQHNNEPQRASRPFDLNRDGFVMGEGAGVVVLESLEHAKARGAHILVELGGYGRTADAYHITAPHEEGLGAIKAMELAIADAGLNPSDVNYINAHGTSTKLNDQIETLAIKKVFGDYAKKIPISSTKSMTGHLLGAAGGIELVACIMSIRDNMVHPTINYETPDPACDLDYVPNVARKVNVDVALSNSLGFGGHNATLVVKRFKE